MRELERRIAKLEDAAGSPSSAPDEAYFAAAERDVLRRSFARMQLAIATDYLTLPLDRAKLRAEVAAEDVVLLELLGGKSDTPEQAEADRALVIAWEAGRKPEDIDAAHARRWPDRPAFDVLLTEYSRLRDGQREIVVEPGANFT